MKFTDFEKLRLVIEVLGASPVIANLENQFKGEGLSVHENIARIVIGDEGIYHIDPSGLLTKVIVNIVDKNISSRYAAELSQLVHNNDFESLKLLSDVHKYHLLKCKVIERAENEGWRDKYKMNRRTDGTFFYRFIENNEVYLERENQRLYVCKICLKEINRLLGSSDTREIFDIDDFFSSSVYETNRLPEKGNYSHLCAPNIYQNDWSEISKRYRALIHYQCENPDCPSPDLLSQNLHQYLHTHHLSLDKSNNQYSNLKALCVYCHANQPNHEQMKKTLDYIQYKRLRNIG